MKKYISLFLLFTLACSDVNAQPTEKSQNRQLLFYNLGFGVISSGIGALINKPKHALGHELIHTYQFQELQVINAYTTPLTDKVRNKFLRSLFTNYVYCDIPYLWFVYPYAGNSENAHHYRNFYEFEAEHFSTNAIVVR